MLSDQRSSLSSQYDNIPNDPLDVYSSKNRRAIIFLILQLLVLIVLLIITLIQTQTYNKVILNDIELDYKAIVFLSHASAWIILNLIKFYLQKKHYIYLKHIGYHRHSENVSWLSSVPVFLFNLTSIAFLTIITFLPPIVKDYHLEDRQYTSLIIEITIYILIVISIPFTLYHLYHEIKFHKDKNPPDIFCIDDPNHFNEHGFSYINLGNSNVLNLLERQSHLISNLNAHSAYLRKIVYRLAGNCTLHPLDE